MLSRYERDVPSPSTEVVEKISLALDVSIDRLVFGKESHIEGVVTDKELISLFKKVQLLNDKHKDTVKDFLSAYVLKIDLKEKLS